MRPLRLQLCLLAAALLDAAAPAPAADAQDWPQWMGPARDGVVRTDRRLVPWPDGRPRVLWRADCGEGSATPVVAGGRLYMRNFREVVCLQLAEGTRPASRPAG